MRWTRSKTNFVLDAAALCVLLSVMWTRVVMHVIVPPPIDGREVVVLWGMNHWHWNQLNFWLTMSFAVVILVHLILHWTWVAQFVHQRYKRWTGAKTILDSGTQTVYGVGTLIAVLVVLGSLLMVAAVAARPI